MDTNKKKTVYNRNFLKKKIYDSSNVQNDKNTYDANEKYRDSIPNNNSQQLKKNLEVLKRNMKTPKKSIHNQKNNIKTQIKPIIDNTPKQLKKFYCASCGYSTNLSADLLSHHKRSSCIDNTYHMEKILNSSNNKCNNNNNDDSFNKIDTIIINTTNITNNEKININLLPFDSNESNEKIKSELNNVFFKEMIEGENKDLSPIVAFVKHVYFNKSKPYNHVIYTKKKNHVYKFTKNNQKEWVFCPPEILAPSLFKFTMDHFRYAFGEDSEDNEDNEDSKYDNGVEIRFRFFLKNHTLPKDISCNYANQTIKKNISNGIEELIKYLPMIVSKFNDPNTNIIPKEKISSQEKDSHYVPLSEYNNLTETCIKYRHKIVDLTENCSNLNDVITSKINDINILRLINENQRLINENQKNKIIESDKIIESGITIIDTLCNVLSSTNTPNLQNILKIVNAHKNMVSSKI